ncbi:MAG: radical SAM protein [Clostridia bacterium]|nr:radical SAM protein [Clostridia bacterium]
MLHPHFMDIISDIYARGMYVEDLNTNGHLLTQEILDEMKKIGCRPLMKISYDGIGHHDWLRSKEGAEENTLRAIRLCIENGFPVKAQTNVHRQNVDTMLPTAKLLSDMGVREMRIIRTSESPRWYQNAGNACLDIDEYFDRMLEFLQEYVKTDCKMDIDVWQFMHLSPKNKTYRPRGIECGKDEYRDSLPVCRGNRGMAAIGANGNLYPCFQISGYFEQHGWFLGNVKEDGLQKHLRSGDYLDFVCTTVKAIKEHSEKCASCKWFSYCCGGCRVAGILLSNDTLGPDLSRCLFFEGGYLEKLENVLPGYKSIYPIEGL